MKITLLLNSVSQDQSGVSKEDVAFHGWMHGPSSGGDGGDNLVSTSKAEKVRAPRLPKYSLRKEPWGGVFVYGPTQAVYQVDDEAYSLVLRLKNGETLDAIVAKPNPFKVDQATMFSTMIRDLSLL